MHVLPFKLILVGLIVLLVAALVYFLSASRVTTQSSNFRQAMITPFASLLYWPLGMLGLSNHKNTNHRSSRSLSLHFHLPSHFTIPILSPWTSVVQHFIKFLVYILTLKVVRLNVKRHTWTTRPHLRLSISSVSWLLSHHLCASISRSSRVRALPPRPLLRNILYLPAIIGSFMHDPLSLCTHRASCNGCGGWDIGYCIFLV